MDLQRLATLSADPLLAAASGRVVFANPAAYRLLGADAGSQSLVGRELRVLWDPDPIGAACAAKGSGELRFAPVRAQRVDGEALDLFVSAVWSSAEDVAIRLDERGADGDAPTQRLLQALAERAREAERAAGARSRFVAAVSHDLRQPMHALGLFVDEVGDCELPPKARELVRHMESALHSTQLLLDSVLVMSRLETGLIVPVFSTFPMQQVLERLRVNFEGSARAKGLRLRVRPCDAAVFSDMALVERILSNLLSNALRYTDTGGVLLACRRRGQCLRIEVRDSGEGIDRRDQDAIFQEFFRIERAGPDRGGLGLGLAIVRSCSALLGCRVELLSQRGRGSTFSIEIPLSRTQAQAADTRAPEEADAAIFSGLRVALVDDDATILHGTRKLLERWGCIVTPAATAREAEVLLLEGAHAPDLVISGLRLHGGESGADLVARLRTRYGEALPALLVSGDTSLQTAREARRHGLALLYKPLPPVRLRSFISNLPARGPGNG